jgi:hypothetical protein
MSLVSPSIVNVESRKCDLQMIEDKRQKTTGKGGSLKKNIGKTFGDFKIHSKPSR